MNLFDIFVRSPINRQTLIVTSQKNTVEIEQNLSVAELVAITKMLERKRVKLKNILGIKSKAQSHGLNYKMNKGFKSFRAEKSPRIALEYRRLGAQMNQINQAISAIKK